MTFHWLDATVFVGFILTVVAVGVFKGRNERDSESYFLAGRGLSWWLIGFSLIAANISTEQFIGMSGSAADYVGLAIASYEWMAAITLVVVAFVFLPRFLRSGIYTIPEFLEYRYNRASRAIMSVFMMIIYIGVTIAAVIYSGALMVELLFRGKEVAGIEISISSAGWAIGILAAVYVACGGLKACAWADLLQGSALIVGGTVVLVLAVKALGDAPPETLGLAAESTAGTFRRFLMLNDDKLHMVLPRNDQNVPWTALIVGLWIPNFYYWGLNQYITQRALGAKSLAEGQKGIVFAAAMKLIIPFIIVVPGIIAFNLYRNDVPVEAAAKVGEKNTDSMQGDARTETNKDALILFEEVEDEPHGAAVAFKFNKDYAQLYREHAVRIAAFNAQVAGLDPPAYRLDMSRPDGHEAAQARALAIDNDRLLDAIGEKFNQKPWYKNLVPWIKNEGEVEIQKELIGYRYDSAFGLLIKRLIPESNVVGLQGFMLAAILGAVISSLASMLNAASTIFTMDLYKNYMNKRASQGNLVAVGRVCVIVFVAIGCWLAPYLGDPRFGGIFKYIQEFQGFISPGILAVFVFGLLVRRAPPICGVVGLLLNPAIYGILMFLPFEMAFLDRMAVSFFCLMALMGVLTAIWPTKEPFKLPTKTKMNLESSGVAKVCGIAVVAVTLVLYALFW